MDAGVAETECPDIHNLNKIEKIYLSQLAEDLCSLSQTQLKKIQSKGGNIVRKLKVNVKQYKD